MHQFVDLKTRRERIHTRIQRQECTKSSLRLGSLFVFTDFLFLFGLWPAGCVAVAFPLAAAAAAVVAAAMVVVVEGAPEPHVRVVSWRWRPLRQ